MEIGATILAIGGLCSALGAIIALVVIIVKPIRNKLVLWIIKTANTEEFSNKFDDINEKIDRLTELVETTVEQNDELQKETNKQSKALQATLRNSILNLYYKCIEKGSVTMFEKQNLSQLYDNYTNLNGNSFISECVDTLKNMKVEG